MKKFVILIAYLVFSQLQAQSTTTIDSLYKPDPYYLEDQLYFGLSYIVLKDLPESLKQNGFSNSIRVGYIRDIPINERRNIGFGVGFGYGRDEYLQNLRISIDEASGAIQFQIPDDADYRSNSFVLNKLEVPIEFRWRGSTPTKYRFWRLYSGVVISRVIGTHSSYISKNINVSYKNIQIINPWQFGLTLSVGYGTWNFNYYYGLSNIIKEGVQVNGDNIKMREMRFGIIYYFL